MKPLHLARVTDTLLIEQRQYQQDGEQRLPRDGQQRLLEAQGLKPR